MHHNKNSTKAHELGPHHYCVCNLFNAPKWVQTKYEIMADRWQLECIMPKEKLIATYKNGNNTPISLADFLDIPVEALAIGLKLYEQIHGSVLKKGVYNKVATFLYKKRWS